MNKKILEILKNKSNELKICIDERNQIEIEKKNFEIELSKEEAIKDLLISQNKDYDEQMEKIKISRLYIKICTLLFNAFLVCVSLFSFFNLLTPAFFASIASIPVMTIIYICVVSKDVTFLKNNKMRFFKKLKKMNDIKIKDIDDKVNELKKQLQVVINNYNICTRNIDDEILEFEKLFEPNQILENDELNKKPLTK